MADPQLPVIRAATLADLEDIRRMQCALADHEMPFDSNIDERLKMGKSGYVGYVNIEEYIKKQGEDHYVVVAEAEQTCVGICYGQIKKDDDWSILDKFGYVGCVFVEERYRGGALRVWARMLEELTGWFKERDIKQLRLECYVNNPAAVRAYEKLDFKPMQYIMHKSI